MKQLFYFLTACSILTLASCSKSYDTNSAEVFGSNPIEYSIVANAPGFDASSTKGTLGAVARVFWNNGDAVDVYEVTSSGISGFIGKLTTACQDDAAKATFTGQITPSSSCTSLAFVYPAATREGGAVISGPYVDLDDHIVYDMADVQSGTNAIKNGRCKFCAYATETFSGGTGEQQDHNKESVSFKLASSFMNVAIADDDTFTSDYTIRTVSILNINTTVTLGLSDGNLAVVTPTEAPIGILKVQYTDAAVHKIYNDGKGMISFGIPASAEASSRIIVISNGTTYFDAPFTKSTLSENKFYSTVVSGFSVPGFSVSTTKKVFFSKGNLYYDKTVSPNVFKFESNQYDFRHIEGLKPDVAFINGVWVNTPKNTIGTFRWAYNSGTLSTDIGEAISTADSMPFEYNKVFFTNEGYTTPRADLTVNGEKGVWRSLSKEEWIYLISTRKVTVGDTQKESYAEGTVMNINGLIILPDSWDGTVMGGTAFTYGKSAWLNVFTEATPVKWSEMESAGCVFIPATGYRKGGEVSYVSSHGFVWSSSPLTDYPQSSYGMEFKQDYVTSDDYSEITYARSVRLVKESK